MSPCYIKSVKRLSWAEGVRVLLLKVYGKDLEGEAWKGHAHVLLVA